MPDGLESFIPGEGENESKEIVRLGGYSPDPATTCGGTVFNHDNSFTDIQSQTSYYCMFLIGMLDLEYWMSLTPHLLQIQTDFLGHKIMKLEDVRLSN